MPSFKDEHGDRWPVVVTVGTLEQIKSQLDLDLLQQPESIPADDLRTLAAMLYIQLEPEILRRNLTPEQFAERLVGGVFRSAVEAFVEGLICFFEEVLPVKGRLMRRKWEAGLKLESLAIQTADEAFAATSGETSTPLPA